MSKVIKRMWLSDEALCIEVSRDLLEKGAAIELEVKKEAGGFVVMAACAAGQRCCCECCPDFEECEADDEY